MKAYIQAFAVFAMIIGIKIISGGIGKKELSEKEIIERNQDAFGCSDFFKVHS